MRCQKVRVIAATYNPQQNVYSVTTSDIPPRTITWTPIVNPDNSSTTSPAVQPESPVYTGATVTPVVGRVDTFPGLVEAGFDDFITVFPVESGLPPLYVMFSEPLDSGIFTRSQLQAKFKHAKHFGVVDKNQNNLNLLKFRNAINEHLSDQDTVEKGTYHHAKKSKVFNNSRTQNVVVLTEGGKFLSGWHLKKNTEQYDNYINGGAL